MNKENWYPLYGLKQPGKCMGKRCWHKNKKCYALWSCKHHWILDETGWHCPICPDRINNEELKNRVFKNPRNINFKLRFKIMKRDKFSCQLCGITPHYGAILEIDHKIPVSKGGGDSENNLWALCFACNRGKGNQIL